MLASILAVAAASLASTEATSQTIAFVAVDPPWLANADYGMVEVASGERRWLRLRPVTAEDPSWSWDGGRWPSLVTTSRCACNRLEERRYLAHRDLSYGNPAVSRDGRQLAYEFDFDIWVSRSDGRLRRRLVVDGEQPDWSPDGRRIVFIRSDAMYVINADGTSGAAVNQGR